MLQEHDGKNRETGEELLPSGHQAPKLKLGLITFTGLNVINCKTFTILHHPHCCYVYIPGTTCLHIPLAHPCLYYYLLSPQYTVRYNLFAHSSCTSLFILLFIKSTVYCIAHFTLFFLIFLFFTYIYIYSLVLRILHCPLSGPDLIYISLQIIFCIIEYVTNKRTLNLEPKLVFASMSFTLWPSAGLPCTILGPSGPLLVSKTSSSVGRSPSIDTAGLYWFL